MPQIEGVASLYKGFVPIAARKVCWTIAYFLTYEQVHLLTLALALALALARPLALALALALALTESPLRAPMSR